MTDPDKEISAQLVRMIQVVFGVVLAQAFPRYSENIVHPLAHDHRLGTLSLLVVYATAVLSWIDWHTTMALRPYSVNRKQGVPMHEKARLFSDLFIVAVYAYLLLAIVEFSSDPSRHVSRFLFGFVLVFIGYVLSGTLRCRAYGSVASNLRSIRCFLAIYLALFLFYWLATSDVSGGTDFFQRHIELTNVTSVVLAGIAMATYRYTRASSARKRHERKSEGLRVGIDIDGVLANQIDGVLARIKHRSGVDLSYSDITDWQLPIPEIDSDIKKEILSAMEDPGYISEMPVHSGAVEAVKCIADGNLVHVITARPRDETDSTRLWLDRHGFSYNELVHAKNKSKSLFGSDLLIDDYIGNVRQFLEKTSHIAVLVDQPYQDRSGLSLH